MRKSYLLLLLFFMIEIVSFAQTDTTYRENFTGPINTKKKWYQRNAVRAAVVPTILIGWGISTIHDHGLYSSYACKRDIRALFGTTRTGIDDYLIFAPYLELAALNLFKIKCRNDFINTGLLIIKSELIMTAIVFPIKNLSHIQRPDSSDYLSFPSGHTAQAFVAASIVHKEYRYKSQWYGIGAYTIAASVGLFRMVNNKHWESDVFVGAGIGILSAHIAYLTHKNKFGRKPYCIAPMYMYGSKGVAISFKF